MSTEPVPFTASTVQLEARSSGERSDVQIQGSLWTTQHVTPRDLCSLAYVAHCRSVVPLCICGSTLFLQGCLETLKKEWNDICGLWQ